MQVTWDENYRNFVITRIKRIQTLVPRRNFKGKYILDVGCWWGWFIRYARESEALVYGFDYVIRRINDAVEHLGNKKGLCIADAQEVPYRASDFDVVFSSHVLEHIEKEDKMLKEIYRVLKKNGNLIVIVPYDYSFGILPFRPFRYLLKNSENILKKYNRYDWLKSITYGDISHYREYTKKTLVRLLERNGFEIIEIKAFGFELPYPFKGRFKKSFHANIDRIFGELVPPFLRSEIILHARKK